MTRFVHFGDLHLDREQGGGRDEAGIPLRIRDMHDHLKKVIDFCLAEEVDIVFFSGDAYEYPRAKQEYKQLFHEQILRLDPIPTILVVGNHDRVKSDYSKHALDEFRSLRIPHTHVIDTPTYLGPDQLGLPLEVVGIPWQYKELDFPLFSLSPHIPSVAVVHATVWGASFGEWETSERVMGKDFVIDLENLTEFDYVALGHIHNPQVLSEDPPIIYPGSVGIQTWGEYNHSPHGFIYGEIDEVGECNWELIPYNSRPRYDYSFSATESQELMEWLREIEIDPNGLYRIRVHWGGDKPRIKEFHIDTILKESFGYKIEHFAPKTRREYRDNPLDDTMSKRDQIAAYCESIGEVFPEKEFLEIEASLDELYR